MNSLAEIEAAIARLKPAEFAKLAQWVEEQRNLKWDQQIEADSASGALDSLLKEVEDDITKNRMRPTDELSLIRA